jgi:predicted kinase
MHGIPIVNPDSVRLAIHGQRFCLSAEQFVWATVNAMIRSLFLAGHNQVILDATNVSRKRRDVLKFNDCETAFHHVDTPVELCKLRAADDPDILPVIDRMALEFEPIADDEVEFLPLGATEKFPRGQLDESDEGEIQIAVATDSRQRIVRIEFGKPVAWLGFPADQARQLAESILKNADRL